MSEPLDVSLRVRMRYEAGGTARQAVSDIEQIRNKANQLGNTNPSERLGRGLADLGRQAQASSRTIVDLNAAATRLGTTGGAGRLEADLKRLHAPAMAATRELSAMGTAAARFGHVSTVNLVQRDVVKLTGALQGARIGVGALGASVERLGHGRGTLELERQLERVGRRADEARMKVDRVGGGPSRRDHQRYGADFGNEFLGAAGLGGGMRIGMSGAAAGGLAAGAAVAATGASLAMATRQAIAFETAMTEVRKATGDGGEGIRALERDILRYSRTTGVAKTEIAELVAQAGYLNVSKKDMPDFADIATKAAVAFRMPGGEAGRSMGQLLNAYGIKDMGQLRLAGDAINVVGDTAGTTERNVLNYLNRVSGTAQQYRLPLEKAAAFGGGVMGLGVEPDVAATGFQALLNRLGTAPQQGGDFQRGLRAIGLRGRQVKKMVEADPEQALVTVLEKIRALPQDKKAGAVADIGGMEHGPGIARMAESLDKIVAALARVRDVSAYAGSMERTFKIFSSDTQAAINRSGAALEGFAVKIGQRFSPAVHEAARYVERLFGGMTKALERGERVQALTAKLSGGGALSEAEKAEMEANPRLKEEVDKRVGIHRENEARRGIVEQEGRDRARNRAPRASGPAGRAGPPMPDEEDAAAARAREAARLKMKAEIYDLGQSIETRRSGGFETTADRLRLRKLQQQYERQFPEGDSDKATLPGTGKRSDLSDAARASLAAYNDEVERSLDKTERLVRMASVRMRADLALNGKVDLGSGNGEAKIQSAALGGGGLGGGLGGGGGSFGPGRTMPGRFGGMSLPERGGGGGRRGGGGGGGGGPSARDGARYGNGGGAGGGTSGPVPAGMMNRAREVYGALRQEGFSHEQSVALLGHAEQESGIGVKTNPKEGAEGLIHWREGRLANLRRFAASRGESGIGSLRTQAAFLRHEMDNDPHERKQSRRFREAKSVDEASQALRPYIRYGDNSTGTRTANARRYDQALRDGGAGTGAVAGGEAGANGQHDPLGGAARRYSSGFGMRNHPVIGGRRMHFGQDMAAPAGTGVNAMEGGRVTAINRHGDVTVTHPDGSTKTYRHINPEGMEVGQQVEGGQRIGNLRARDPRSTGPHLHMEATDAQGRRIDPMPQIREANRRRNDPAMAGGGALDRMPENWRRRLAPDGGEAMISPRFGNREQSQLKPLFSPARAGGGLPGMGSASSGAGESRPAVQHFYGGFDEQTVARRAQLEQNRQIRRSYAGGLHDVG